MLFFSAIIWNKLPPKPVNGILGENVTLEWNFTLASGEEFDYFVLLRQYLTKMVKYDHTGVLLFYGSFNESVGLVRNGTPSFMLMNLKFDDGATYCCDVNTKETGGGQGHSETECTQLKILGETSNVCLFHTLGTRAVYVFVLDAKIASNSHKCLVQAPTTKCQALAVSTFQPKVPLTSTLT